jgi:hypothetical protein
MCRIYRRWECHVPLTIVLCIKCVESTDAGKAMSLCPHALSSKLTNIFLSQNMTFRMDANIKIHPDSRWLIAANYNVRKLVVIDPLHRISFKKNRYFWKWSCCHQMEFILHGCNSVCFRFLIGFFGILRYESESRWFDPRWCHGNFYWHNPSDRTMALGSTQPQTEMSIRCISWG